ncbi:MAG: TonB-dependent receptor [Melioribacteraceae bacterium]|nr:TonB-dependent receptor [Melioribacteraceae bacterium]
MKQTFLLIFLFFSVQCFGQADTLKSKLSEITISANKYETPLFQTASSISVITAKQISESQSNSVVDLLKTVPGISISQQGGTGKLSSVFMRGANSSFLLVMVDNVEINDPSSANNAFDFSSLQTADIERIEIVRGPQSTLYGSEAAAGVVNIITKSGQGKPSYSLIGEGGTNNYYNGSVSANGEYSGFNYLLNFTRLQTDAISSIKGENFEADGYSNNSGFVKLGYHLQENISANISYKYVDTETDLDQSEKGGDDPNFTSDFKSHLFSMNLNGSFLNGLWETQLRGSLYKNSINALDEVDELRPSTSSISNYDGNRLSFNWQNNLKFVDHNLVTIGVDFKQDEAESNYHSEGVWGPFDSNFPKTSLSTAGIYLQDLVTLNNFSATAGLRYDNNEKFGSVTTFRFAPMYFIEPVGTKIKGTYGTGFKAPSLFNLFAPFYGNIDLKPEKSKGWDLGFEQYLFSNNVMFGITYFNMKFEDMLGFDENFVSININEAETKGIEAILSVPNFVGFSFNASYTYNETYDISTTELKDLQLIRRPKNQFSVNANYSTKKFSFGISAINSGEKFDNDFSTFPTERVTLKGYTLIDLRAAYNITEYLSLHGRVENLLNEQYQDILYYGTKGRAGYIGFELSL